MVRGSFDTLDHVESVLGHLSDVIGVVVSPLPGPHQEREGGRKLRRSDLLTPFVHEGVADR